MDKLKQQERRAQALRENLKRRKSAQAAPKPSQAAPAPTKDEQA